MLPQRGLLHTPSRVRRDGGPLGRLAQPPDIDAEAAKHLTRPALDVEHAEQHVDRPDLVIVALQGEP